MRERRYGGNPMTREEYLQKVIDIGAATSEEMVELFWIRASR
jgi:hypothetical protein